MERLKTRALALLAVVAVAACSGSTGPQGTAGQNGTNGTDGTDGANGANGAAGPTGPAGAQGPAGAAALNSSVEQCLLCHGAGQLAAVADMHGTNSSQATRDGINVTNISIANAVQAAADGRITVKFSLKDNSGRPIDIGTWNSTVTPAVSTPGVFSVNTTIKPKFSLAYYDIDGSGVVSAYTVLTKTTSPTTVSPPVFPLTTDSSGSGTMVAGTNPGDYVYTFPATGSYPVSYPATSPASGSTRTFVLWFEVARQMNLNNNDGRTYSAIDKQFNFDPATGTGFIAGTGPNGDQSPATAKREIVLTSNCNNCHRGNKPEVDGSGAYHGGSRNEGPYCNICHNPARKSTATTSDGVTPAAASKVYIHRIHNSASLQTGNLFHGINITFPQDIRNCATCHGKAAQGDQAYSQPTRAACGSCHDYVDFAGTNGLPVCNAYQVVVDANGIPVPCLHVGGAQTDDTKCALCHSAADIKSTYHVPVVPPDPTNCITQNNAPGCNSHTNAGWLPAAGVLPSNAAAITYDVKSVSRNASKQPVIVFRFLNNGTAVVFNDPAAKKELMDNFAGSPSVYFAFGVAQDGIAAPADFNASASGSIKAIWNGTATNSSKGTMTFDSTTGYYTITLTGVTVPDSAVMLTGGVGYSYGTSLTSMPLTQTNLTAYPYNSTTGYGGLIMPAHNVWATATGYKARRPVVDNDKCLTCHAELGANPTFHAGQRNDGPTCTFCHNANRTSSGWAINIKDFVHSIHAGDQRAVPFTYNGSSFTDVTFPGALNDCTACHLPGTFDFSASASAAAVPNLLWSTAATGKISGADASPWVATDGTDYGVGFSFNAGTGATTAAASTNLVISPIMGACVACHVDATARAHMEQNGGSFYQPRTAITASQAK